MLNQQNLQQCHEVEYWPVFNAMKGKEIFFTRYLCENLNF